MNLPIGTLLQGGKYEIKRFISAGGFGCTYEGVHTMLDTHVAIKEFFVKDFCNRDEQTSHVTVGTQGKVELVQKLRSKFVDEAKALYKMQHPNIVRVLDIFEENGTAYYVMDYIDGQSLHEIVKKRGAIPEHEVLEYVEQISNALKYVHGQNRLHLDIKPGNIMIDNDGVVKLIDFGASKQYDEVDGENTSTLLGKTPGYAPIEQMGNTVRTFTPATDIYALGATMYKCLTGVTPPDATLLMEEGLEDFPQSISSTTKAAIEKAMEVMKKNRPQTIDEFLSLLHVSSDTVKTSSNSSVNDHIMLNIDEEQTIIETKPIIKKGKAIDLGLSVKWADMNIGAEYPYETGEFFGFGDVTGKMRGMSIEKYPAPNPPQIISGTQYDIAQYHWGDAWRMPTKQNIEELISKCTIKNTHINGKPCCEITGPNGNSIILPSTSFLHPSGNIDDTYLRVAGMYWSGNISSSTQAYYLHIVAGKLQLGERGRYFGLAVRPVYNK